MTNFTHGFQYSPKQKQKQKPDPMDMVTDLPFRITFKWIWTGSQETLLCHSPCEWAYITRYLKKVTN